jgi:hypothetical protein
MCFQIDPRTQWIGCVGYIEYRAWFEKEVLMKCLGR